jgi:hypothetical protein
MTHPLVSLFSPSRSSNTLNSSRADLGYISWAFQRIADKDAVAVRILRDAGAVFYVKTANPQTLLAREPHLG